MVTKQQLKSIGFMVRRKSFVGVFFGDGGGDMGRREAYKYINETTHLKIRGETLFFVDGSKSNLWDYRHTNVSKMKLKQLKEIVTSLENGLWVENIK